MKTMVTYSSSKRPVNDYPKRIISPPTPGICCLTHMERIGDLEEEDSLPFFYKRCRSCGFTVRWFPEEAIRLGLKKAADQTVAGVVGGDGMVRRRVPVKLFPRRKTAPSLLKLPLRRHDRKKQEEKPRVVRKRTSLGTR